MDRDLQRILSDLFKYLRRDKKRFIKFCLERGHKKQDIARAMKMDPSGLSQFIKRHMGGK